MKLFFAILCFFNILSACTITFFDQVKEDDKIYGQMKFLKEVKEQWAFDKGKLSHVFFLNENSNLIGESFACWKHCNRTEKHRSYDAFVVESIREQEYHICVYTTWGQHEFDMILAKNEISKNYEIHMFERNQNRCMFADPALANNLCCCVFSGNDLAKLLQKNYLLDQAINKSLINISEINY